MRVQKLFFSVTRHVRSIHVSSYDCSSTSVVLNMLIVLSGKLNIFAKRKYEYSIALFKIGSLTLKFHTAKNKISLIVFFSFRKLPAWGRLEKNNGGDIDGYFQNLLKFHHTVCRKRVTTPICLNKFKLESSAIEILLNSPCNSLSWRHSLHLMIKPSKVSSSKIWNSETLCSDEFNCHCRKVNSVKLKLEIGWSNDCRKLKEAQKAVKGGFANGIS